VLDLYVPGNAVPRDKPDQPAVLHGGDPAFGLGDLFNYHLEPKERAQLVAGLISEGDEIKLQLAAKVLNAICR
jgi:hypothetical protein